MPILWSMAATLAGTHSRSLLYSHSLTLIHTISDLLSLSISIARKSAYDQIHNRWRVDAVKMIVSDGETDVSEDAMNAVKAMLSGEAESTHHPKVSCACFSLLTSHPDRRAARDDALLRRRHLCRLLQEWNSPLPTL